MKNIEVFNETTFEIDIEEIKKLTDYLVKYMNVENAQFNVIFINNEKIREINKSYRGIDRETDVISFALEDEKTIRVENERILGDIYISVEKAKMQAEEYGHSFKREICFLTTHGFLHLLGYDHMKKEDEEVMFKLQEEILDSYGIKRQ